MSSSPPREYDIVLLGATGHTGKLCAEYITTSLPTDLKWAVAGRSYSKLSALIDGIKTLNPNRLQPGIEVATLTPTDLNALAARTRVLLNTVGPYYLYSTPVVEACVENGTHYLDVTGETPWVFDIINEFHDKAKARKAIIIPEAGIESTPSDLLAWSLVRLIRDKLSVGTQNIVASVSDLKGMPSGGTLATILGLFDHYSLKEVANAFSPWALSPVQGPKSSRPLSFVTRLLGLRFDPNLGTLTTFVAATGNTAIVHRTWGLQDGGRYYGPKFHYSEYIRVRNALVGIGIHFLLALAGLALLFPPARWLAKKFVYQPGQGASKESSKSEVLEYRSIATADQDTPNPSRAIAKFRYDGALYYLTGIFIAEAAMVILREEEMVRRLGGGVLTPAMLGQPFIERLKNAGIVYEVGMLPSSAVKQDRL